MPKVRVIDHEGENLGVMFTREAVSRPMSFLNLVEVSPNADPPVCKFLDVGKHRYEAQKKRTSPQDAEDPGNQRGQDAPQHRHA